MAKTPKGAPDTEPKQRPVKRPAKPRAAYSVPRGICYIDADGEQTRHRAGAKIAEGVIPDAILGEYLERGDVLPLNNDRKAD